jgi:hypothetical protein
VKRCVAGVEELDQESFCQGNGVGVVAGFRPLACGNASFEMSPIGTPVHLSPATEEDALAFHTLFRGSGIASAGGEMDIFDQLCADDRFWRFSIGWFLV